jgi:hypothetical protein
VDYDTFGGSLHRSTAQGATATITFTGRQIAIYGQVENFEPRHPVATRPEFQMQVAVNGRQTGDVVTPDGRVNLYINDPRTGVVANQRLYMSPVMDNDGPHTVTVTALSSFPVNIDRVKVFSGEYALSETITISVEADPLRNQRVSLPDSGWAFAGMMPAAIRGNLGTLVAEFLEEVQTSLFTPLSALAFIEVNREIQDILANPEASNAVLAEAYNRLLLARRALEDAPEAGNKSGLIGLMARVVGFAPLDSEAQAVYEAAKAVINNPAADEAGINTAVTGLIGVLQNIDPQLAESGRIHHHNDRTDEAGRGTADTVFFWSSTGRDSVREGTGNQYSGEGPHTWPLTGWLNTGRYTRTLRETTASGGSGNAARIGAVRGDFFEITFEGRQIELWADSLDNSCGWADITIFVNGSQENPVTDAVNLHREHSQNNVMFYRSPVLPPGIHTIRVSNPFQLGPRDYDRTPPNEINLGSNWNRFFELRFTEARVFNSVYFNFAGAN